MRFRSLALIVLTVTAVGLGGGGCGESSRGLEASRPTESGGDVSLRDTLKKKPKYDAVAIRRMLQDKGASPDEAQEIVDVLSSRLSPDEMHVWLSHPKKSHGIPDPDAAKEMEDAGLIPGEMNWTAVNAVAQGKTHLVIAEAKRYAGG